MSSSSPLTGAIDETHVIIEFGEHEGKTVSEIKDEDPDHYHQLVVEKKNQAIAIRKDRDKKFRLYLNPLMARSS